MREDVMVYSAMLGGFCALASGFCFDVNFVGTAWAFLAISVVSVLVLCTAYLHSLPPSSSTHEHPQDYP